MFKHILVATDGSERADRAVAAAVSLAGHHGATVTALLVVPDYASQPFAEVLAADAPTREALRQSLEAAGRRRLGTSLEGYGGASVRIEREVVVGESAHHEILKTAERKGCDLIVMASHGRGAVRSALLGSQTLDVIGGAAVPVLVVK